MFRVLSFPFFSFLDPHISSSTQLFLLLCAAGTSRHATAGTSQNSKGCDLQVAKGGMCCDDLLAVALPWERPSSQGSRPMVHSLTKGNCLKIQSYVLCGYFSIIIAVEHLHSTISKCLIGSPFQKIFNT
jgi:hypothetical protein